MKEYLFVQKISHKRKRLELDFLKSATLILKINSLAPRLALKILNPGNAFLEDAGLKLRDRLEVAMEDIASGSKGETASFVIVGLRADENPDVLVLDCLEENASRLERRDCRIFNRRSVPAILKSLAPGLKTVCGKFPDKNTYHLPNERRFSLIARMLREHGAVFFLNRGELTFKTAKELLKQPNQAVYEYRNPDAERQITNPRLIDRDYRTEDGRRRYLGWHMEKGLVSASVDRKRPPRMVSCDTRAKLNNLSLSVSPALSFQSAGNGGLALGAPLKLIWHSGLPERPLDESYPDRALVGQLVHHERRGEKGISFTTKIYGVI